MTTYRWYTLGRVTPLADGKIVALEPNAEYTCIGWSRTKEQATEKRDKLDRAGRQGINLYCSSRAQMARSAYEVYGIIVDGYLTPDARALGRMLIKSAVVRAIFCPFTKVVLDMRRAVYVECDGRSYVMAATHWDEKRAGVEEAVRARGCDLKVFDGREFFRR